MKILSKVLERKLRGYQTKGLVTKSFFVSKTYLTTLCDET